MKIDNYINITILYVMLIALIIVFIFMIIQSIVIIAKNIIFFVKGKQNINIKSDDNSEYFTRKSNVLLIEKFENMDYGLGITYTLMTGNVITEKFDTEKEQQERYKEICEELEK